MDYSEPKSKRQERREKTKSHGDNVYSTKHIRKQEALLATREKLNAVIRANKN